ncbi:MAG: TIM barrel protein [Candidatus ainarchaeum sp.]|nr:TIM barrel protein [Candidatus ainarchaeum sp.]
MAEKILFGTAGVPHSSKGPDSVSGIERVRELGLDAMELEFVRGVHMGEETARLTGEAAQKQGVMLRVHAPYFINLNSSDKKKLGASKKRILDSARIGSIAGAKIVTFHPAFFQGEDKKQVLEKVISEIGGIIDEIKNQKLDIALAPETTGKPTQLGSLQETIAMCSSLKELQPMIDFSHLHARENGRFKNKKDFENALNEIPVKFLKFLHMHASGINFSEKGERNHMNMEETGNSFNYKWLIEALKEKKVSGCIICESPNLEDDALLMQGYYSGLQKNLMKEQDF